MNKPLIDHLKKYLTDKKLAFWTMNSVTEHRYENYLIFLREESLRTVKDELIRINVWVNHSDGKGNYTGRAKVAIPMNADTAMAEKLIDGAILAAGLVKNKAYAITQDSQKYDSFENTDPSIVANPGKTLESLTDLFRSTSAAWKGPVLSTTEIFLSIADSHFFNSAGNEYEFRQTSTMLESVILAGADMETESIFTRRGVLVDHTAIRDLLNRYATYANDSLHATLPKTGKYPVVFAEEALPNFFDFFYAHADASAFFNKFSQFNLEKPVFEIGNGDPLTVISDPFVRGGGSSCVADQYGFAARKFTLIDSTVFKTIPADIKFSQYLDIPHTGTITNPVISGGTKSYDSLVGENGTLLLTRFSNFTPKQITGDFSAEIRLGYLFEKGTVTPIKGGSVSGNIRALMPTGFMTKETVSDGAYNGPKGIKFYNVDIAGA